jgi:putative heme-binding domain-containing protein
LAAVRPLHAEAPGPLAQWIWTTRLPCADDSAHFRREFRLLELPERAELRALADDSLRAYVNGRLVGEAAGHVRWTTWDATAVLRLGDNALAVEGHSRRGPAGVAVRLDMEFADGTRRAIVSDPRWKVSRAADAGWRDYTYDDADWIWAESLGLVGVEPWGAPEDLERNYDQWKLALGAEQASDPALLAVLPGFEVELLHTATPEEGSWVSLAFDPRGRLLVGREGSGILRLTPSEAPGDPPLIETVNNELQECRGLVWAYDSLFANANNSLGLYRLRDTDGDDRFDQVTLLRTTGGGVGHGRNDLVLGPDGMLYLAHGNNVLLPEGFAPGSSPLRNYGADRLRPCVWDRSLFDAGVEPPGGHIVRTDADGQRWELVAGGFRNSYGLDFSPEGELFAYDSDMEWDAGAPWYRPTRVNHVVSAGDYGYRQGTGNRPSWMADTLPTNLDIGLGSPTGVKFATGSLFPEPYRRALFIQDWAYGRMYALHLLPRGASYTFAAELFLQGQPLNVTDLEFGPDGQMWFATGGRGTRTGLYRVRPVSAAGEPGEGTGPVEARYVVDPLAKPDPAADARAAADRRLRQRLESFHGRVDPAAIDEAWPLLDSADPWLRWAARAAVEAQPVDAWRDRALSAEPRAAGEALLALARVGAPSDKAALFERLAQYALVELAPEERLIVLRAYAVACVRMGRPTGEQAAELRARMEPLFPTGCEPVDQELGELLAYLEAPAVVPMTLQLLDEAETRPQRLWCLHVLRNVRHGWDLELRKRYFEHLRAADAWAGGVYLPTFVENIRNEAAAWLTDDERAALGELVAPAEPADEAEAAAPRSFVRAWQLADVESDLERAGHARDFARGERLFAETLCRRCHRLAGRGGRSGPDLAGAGQRFGRRDLLETILAPSKAVDEKYRSRVVQTVDGETLIGRVVGASETALVLAVDPLDLRQVRQVELSAIEDEAPAALSPMPEGLLNGLSADEILDLLAYVQAAGDPQHPNFQPAR